MNMVPQDSARANRILGALPMADYMPLVSHLEAVNLSAGQVIEAPGVACTHVYFPVGCAISLISATRDGEMSALALTGREGLAGLPALLGAPSSAMQSVVLRPGLAYRLPVAVVGQALQRSAALHGLALRYVQSLMLQMAQGVVCSLHHSVLQRLSSWLLYHETVTACGQVRATHETIAHMLGVRRESITQAAGLLQGAGCISTSRGRITLHDLQGLREHVCECFAMVEEDHQQLWEGALPLDGHAVHNSMGVLQHITADDADDEAPDQNRYADIYDFAPVGLLSVDSQGRLIEANMAAAIQLGISRSQCHQYRFVDFLQPESRQPFEQFHREVLNGKCRRHCELGLMAGAHRPAAVVRLDATVDESGEENRMVMVDVTDSHRQMAQLLHGHGRETGLSAPQNEGDLWWAGAAATGQAGLSRAAGF